MNQPLDTAEFWLTQPMPEGIEVELMLPPPECEVLRRSYDDCFDIGTYSCNPTSESDCCSAGLRTSARFRTGEYDGQAPEPPLFHLVREPEQALRVVLDQLFDVHDVKYIFVASGSPNWRRTHFSAIELEPCRTIGEERTIPPVRAVEQSRLVGDDGQAEPFIEVEVQVVDWAGNVGELGYATMSFAQWQQGSTNADLDPLEIRCERETFPRVAGLAVHDRAGSDGNGGSSASSVAASWSSFDSGVAIESETNGQHDVSVCLESERHASPAGSALDLWVPPRVSAPPAPTADAGGPFPRSIGSNAPAMPFRPRTTAYGSDCACELPARRAPTDAGNLAIALVLGAAWARRAHRAGGPA